MAGPMAQAAQPAEPAQPPPAPPPRKQKPLLRLLDLLASRAHALSVVLLLAGTLGLLALPLLERPITFDEKGLLAGSAFPTLR